MFLPGVRCRRSYSRGTVASPFFEPHRGCQIISRKPPISCRDQSQIDQPGPRRGIRSPSPSRTARYWCSRSHIHRAPYRSPSGKAFASIRRHPQNERICDRAVLPGNPAEARGNRYQDLGHGRRAHGKFGSLQQRFELRHTDADRHQRVSISVVVIESSWKSFAFVDGKIKLKLVAPTPRRIWPDRVGEHRTTAAGVERCFRSRLDARGAVEKSRKLGERDRSLVIKATRRMAFTQELRERRDCLRIPGRELAQIDFFSGPARPHRRWRGHDTYVWIKSAQRVGVSDLRATRVEQKIVKVPNNEVVVTLGRSEAILAGSVDLEKNLAVNEQGEKLNPWKTVLATEPLDLLGCGQHGQGGRNLRIANFEQRAGARRFQDHLIGAPSHVRESREDENVGIVELWHSRPIIGNLRLDDDLVLPVSRAPKAVLQ